MTNGAFVLAWLGLIVDCDVLIFVHFQPQVIASPGPPEEQHSIAALIGYCLIPLAANAALVVVGFPCFFLFGLVRDSIAELF